MMKNIIKISLASIVLASAAQGAVTIVVSEVGNDLKYTFSGSFNPGTSAFFPRSTITNQDFIAHDLFSFYSISGAYYAFENVGTRSGFDPFIDTTYVENPSNGSGIGFGFIGDAVVWDESLGGFPTEIIPTRSFTQLGKSIATSFGSNLDAGPVLLWTHNTTGDTISIAAATVPEPTSTLLLSSVVLPLMLRRRRQY